MINALLLFFAIPYVFWGLCLGLTVWSYCLIHDEDDFHFGAATLIGLLIAGLAYRFESLKLALVTWPDVAYLAGAYLGAGVILAGYKYLMLLVDFRVKAREWLAKNPNPRSDTDLSQALYSSYNKVTKTKEGTYHLDHRYWPVANWIAFWPLFSFSVVLDPIWRASKRLAKWLGSLLERLSKAFSVS